MKSAAPRKTVTKKASVKKDQAKKTTAAKTRGKRAPFVLTPLERVVQTALSDAQFVTLLFKNPDAALASKKIRLTNSQRNTLLGWLDVVRRQVAPGASGVAAGIVVGPHPVWPGDLA